MSSCCMSGDAEDIRESIDDGQSMEDGATPEGHDTLQEMTQK